MAEDQPSLDDTLTPDTDSDDGTGDEDEDDTDSDVDSDETPSFDAVCAQLLPLQLRPYTNKLIIIILVCL